MSHSRRIAQAFCLIVLLPALAGAQSLYKYRGENGEWIFSDRPPDDERTVEVRQQEITLQNPEVIVTHGFAGEGVQIVANNAFYVPVELVLVLKRINGLEFPDPEERLRWVLPPRTETPLLYLPLQSDATEAPFLEYGYRYMPGDPNARHTPSGPYRVPFAISSDQMVTQAFPDTITHTTPDSYYAVDFAAPVGTDVFAARGGIVFDVASKNFRSGLDPVRDGPAANVVRIMHDDGTYAIYAHLNWNSIRVKPGDQVSRGEYIADSGNTGYSTGPHLHFAVVKNVGLRAESVPVTFSGSREDSVTPARGTALTAY
ncbi:MAG: M23 family metallopeptidase [Pseudomonadota bacterium]